VLNRGLRWIRITAKMLEKTAKMPSDCCMPTALQVARMPTAAAVALIRAGLPATAFEATAEALALTVDELATKLGVSPRTIRDQRQRKVRLSAENTEKLVRVARIQTLGRTLFSTDDGVADWLRTPAPALHGTKPIDLLDTDTGAREIEAVLHGMAFGHVM
jgi:putative toxin-antitoxin system antitoxin component (TIGR02293 family)